MDRLGVSQMHNLMELMFFVALEHWKSRGISTPSIKSCWPSGFASDRQTREASMAGLKNCQTCVILGGSILPSAWWKNRIGSIKTHSKISSSSAKIHKEALAIDRETLSMCFIPSSDLQHCRCWNQASMAWVRSTPPMLFPRAFWPNWIIWMCELVVKTINKCLL